MFISFERVQTSLNKYQIQGGKPLHGTITISGAKNAAVAIIPAALLVDGVCRIENIPQISDVTLILQILQELGADVRTVNRTTVDIDCSHIRNRQVPYELARKIRASYYLVGALLGRFGWAEVPLPGGCDLGGRPIDQHIKGFVAMGADVDVRNGLICAKVPGGRLSGGQIYLDMVSVGATMNIMLAGVLADGMTIIENAAKEPHIVDLANFLNSMGANIMGAGTDVIKIRGVKRLKGGTYSIIPVWPPWPLPAATCSFRTSFPSIWTASLPSWWRWAWMWRSWTTRCGYAALAPSAAPT